MRLSIAQKILEIADKVDARGFHKEADMLTRVVREAQMPGQQGWTPNPSIQKPAPAAAAPQPPAAPQAQQTNPSQWQQMAGQLTAPPQFSNPGAPGYINTNPMPATQYPGANRPMTPQDYSQQTYPQQGTTYSQPSPNGTSWYGYNPAKMQQDLMNMQIGGLYATQNGKAIPLSMTPAQMMERELAKIKSQGQSDPNVAIENARQLQIRRRRQELQNEDAQLANEEYNQSLGNGNPGSYR